MSLPGYLKNAHRFEWNLLVATLRWNYGPERAAQILAGKDKATNDDIARWRALGERRQSA